MLASKLFLFCVWQRYTLAMTPGDRFSPTQQRALRAFCEKHGVKALALFGSVITDRFGAHSDVTCSSSFYRTEYQATRFFSLGDELEHILERPVDVTTTGGPTPRCSRTF